MGMFDTVVVEGLKLPELPKNIKTFLSANNSKLPSDYQTKDLDNCLSTYNIDKHGQIYLTVYKPTGKKEPYKDIFESIRDNRSFLEKLYYNYKFRHLNKTRPKFITVKKPYKEKTGLSGVFNIYNYAEIAGRYIDVEFELVAEKGKVIKTKLIKTDIESENNSKKRRARDDEYNKKFQKSIDARKKFTSSWYYPVLKEVLNPTIFFSKLTIQAICNKILKWTNSWHGV